jgi:hypothetical protein
MAAVDLASRRKSSVANDLFVLDAWMTVLLLKRQTAWCDAL